MSCVPLMRTPTCAKHKCRCAKPIPLGGVAALEKFAAMAAEVR